jgi:hypothetical protein
MDKNWEDLVYETADRFGGQLPHPETSETLHAVYDRAPLAVAKAIDRVARDFEAGTVRSPWGVLRSRVAKIADDAPKHAASNEREKAISRAEQWLRTAGMHYHRPSEIEQELFGSAPADLDVHGEPIVSSGRAILGAFANDADLRLRMVNLWRELRATGERLEAEQIERLARHRRQREQIEAEVALARKLAEAQQ